MWDYTDKVLDHFRNPRNVGMIEKPDGVGTVGSLACGDALTLMFKLGADQRIAEVKFKTFGCASAIASSSALTEMVIGKTVEEAARITNQQIAEYLGGLPEQKMHCSVMGREALEAAIHNYRTGETVVRDLHDEKIVCACFGVSENEVLRVVRENSLTTVEQITNFCKAGGGCGQCKPELQALLDQVEAERQALMSAPKTVRKLTNLQRIQMIQDVIEREIRPVLRRDQGDIELVDIDGPRVTIAFRGMCAGCQSAELTRRGLVEAKLHELVANDIVVEEDR
jgi:NifU-like protein